MMWGFRPIGTFVLLAAFVSAAQGAKRPVELDDFARYQTVNDPQISPDGRWVAYTVTASDTVKDKRDTDLWMARWDGTREIRLTSTWDSSESMPRWSPDNKHLAFLTARGDEKQKQAGAQVWLLDRAGGEARQLTSIKGGVLDYAWSPDARQLVLVVQDPDPNDEPEKKEGWKRATAPPIVIDRYQFKKDVSGYLQPLRSHLYLFDVDKAKPQQLTAGRFDETSPAWSPDGRLIAFVSNRNPDPDRNNDSNIFVIEPKPGAEPRQRTTFPGFDGGRPVWSPDSRMIAYVEADETRFQEYLLNKLAVVPAKEGEPKVLTRAIDRPIQDDFAWTSDSRRLVFSVVDDRTSYVASIAATGGPITRLTSGQRVVPRLARRDDDSFAVLMGTSNSAEEIYALEDGELRPLSHRNDALVGELQLGATEGVASKSEDGTEVHGILLKPPGYVAGTSYPLVLQVHGGPNDQNGYTFRLDWQHFAAHGYLVLGVNYRGSEGRGYDYQKAIVADWGNKEVGDLLGAVDALVERGIADPQRLGIGGWSYGGILTDFTIAKDTRFKAAVSGAGTAFPLALYGLDEHIWQYDNELPRPWVSLEPWLKISYPFLHADRIRTPTLFLGCEKDFNVPLAGCEQMFQALRSQHIDTQLVIYPGQHHLLTKPSYIRDRWERSLGWFDKYLKPSSANP